MRRQRGAWALQAAQPTALRAARMGAENTLFRPQQGSENAAVQDVRSANNMNDATQPQHFTLRSGSSTSGSPASSRLLSVWLPTTRRLLGPEPCPSLSRAHGRAPVPGSHAGACLRPALTSWRETLRLRKKNKTLLLGKSLFARFCTVLR